jgi:hypothetical protein
MCRYYIGHLLTKSSHCSHGPCVKESPFSGCDLGSQDCLGQWCCVQSNKSMGFFTPKDKFIKFRFLLLIAKSGAKMSSIPCIYWCSTKPSKWHSRIQSVSFLEILIFITAEMTPTVLWLNCLQLLSKWSGGGCSPADSIHSRDVTVAGSCILFVHSYFFCNNTV